MRRWVVDHRWELALWSLALVAGWAMRIWILGTALGGADLDEATVGIQAGRFLDGERSAFFLNQAYGGTVETSLVAAVFGVFGAGVVTLKVVPMVLALLAAVLSHRIAVELDLSRTARWVVPVLVWCGPAYAVLFSTKERGFYGVALVLAAAYPWLVLRLAKRSSVSDALLLGLCIGVGWWQTPLTFAVAVPAVAWLLCVRPGVVADLWWSVPAAVAGALPWFVWNARNDWESIGDVASFGTTWWDRFFDWTARLNVVMGVETPFVAGRRMVDSRWAGLVLLILVLVVATKRTNWDAPWFLVTMVVGYGVIYAINGLAAGVGADPRYTYLMVPIVAVCIGAALPDLPSDRQRFLVASGVTVLAVVTTGWGLAGVRDEAERPSPNMFLASPRLDDVADLLEDRDVRAVISDIAGMQLAFLTDESVVGASFAVPRLDTYEVVARAADPSVYVLDEDLLGNAEQLRTWLEANDKPFEEVEVGPWRVFFLSERVLPGDADLFVLGGQL